MNKTGIFLLLAALAPAANAQCAALREAHVGATATADQYYGLAYCAALDGKADEAFAHLGAADARGFYSAERMKADPDFASLHGDPRWPAAVAAAEAAAGRFRLAGNEELRAIYRADQEDRRTQPVDWAVVEPRDKARQKRVAELAGAGQLRHGDDFFHAAFNFQHSGAADGYPQAMQWALRAVELGATAARARWLMCATGDRYLQQTGKAQAWGTQFTSQDGRKWTMEPVDRAAHTDEERRANGVPTLARSAVRLDKMNAEP